MADRAQDHDDRGWFGKTKRLTGREAKFCHPVPANDLSGAVETSDVGGVLLKITPYQESDGVVSGIEMLRALYEVATRDINSFEIWFDEGQIHFYLYCSTSDAAEKARRKIRGSYPNAQVVEIKSGKVFPAIGEDEYLAAARIDKENPIHYLPIRRHDDDEWEHDDPYTQVLGEMVSTDDTRVAVQGTMRAVPKSWTNGDGDPGGWSASERAEKLRSNDVKGWIPDVTVREVEPTDTEIKQADIISEQHRKPAFEVNVRVLAISPSPQEAANRAQGVATSYSTYYDTQARQGLEPIPLTSRVSNIQRASLRKHVRDMRQRNLDPEQAFIMTFKEGGGAFHIPSGEIPVQQIQWKRTRSGGDIPRGAPGK